MSISPLWKKRPKILDKREKAQQKLTKWVRVCREVTARDGGKCRVCGGYGHHHHHVKYRSRGGKDEVRNVVLTCFKCHQEIHAHLWIVTYDAADPAGTFCVERNTQWD